MPEANKKAALLDGKARFHRFLDTLAANLRAGKTILSDLPTPVEEEERAVSGVEAESVVRPEPPTTKRAGSNGDELKQPTPNKGAKVDPQAPPNARSKTGPSEPLEESPSPAIQPETPVPKPKPPPTVADNATAKKRWGLFG